jgi:dihydrofolate synthase/folylpolyglutamate synthase
MSSDFQWFQDRVFFGVKAGLENMQTMCARMADPQKNLKVIHVVGSNGKGSTAAILANLLQNKGKVALFTSPHLVSVRERFRINGKPISSDKLNEYLKHIRSISSDLEPTFFEVATMIALLWFSEENVDWAVLEAGLGGRWDCTKIANGSLALLSSISLEHTKILGNTKGEILLEKAQVLAEGGLLIHALNATEYDLFSLAVRLGVNMENHLSALSSLPKEYDHWPAHQKSNLALAYSAYEKIVGGDTLPRLKNFHWAARNQCLEADGKATVFLDGAHNPDSILKWKESLASPQKVILGVLDDKDFNEIWESISDVVSELYLVKGKSPRFLEPREMQKIVNKKAVVFNSVPELIQQIQKEKYSYHCIGSLYLMGEMIENLCFDYPQIEWFQQFSADTNETTLQRK